MNIQKRFIIISAIIFIIIVLLSYVEMTQCEHSAIFTLDIREVESKGCLKLHVDDHTIYVYNKITFPIPYNDDYESSKYIKSNVTEHLASKVLTPIKSIFCNIKDCPHNSAPINTLYNAVSEGASIFNIVQYLTGVEQKLILEHHKNDNISAFIEDGFLYIIPERYV